MIAYLIGKITIVGKYALVMTKGGVGYQVFCGGKLMNKLAVNDEQEKSLFIHSYIREDRWELYGFAAESDLNLFELLIGISGCGPKMALAVTDAGSQAVIAAVRDADVSFFSGFPRVGKKLAQKMIIELKTKLGGKQDLDLETKSDKYNDAFEALLSLGFAEKEVSKVLREMEVETLEIGEAIKLALQKIKR